MNTLYQKSTKINIFHAHTFYRYVYMYIYYMQTLLIQSTATTRLVLDAENWSVQFKFGNSLWGFLERWRDSREAVKKCQERVMDNCGQACLSLSSTPTRRVEDLDNLRFFFVFCLWIGVTQSCVSAGLWGWGWKMGEEKGEKTELFRTERHLCCFPGWVQCLHARAERWCCPFPSTSWSKIGTFPWKISNKVFVPSFQENV